MTFGAAKLRILIAPAPMLQCWSERNILRSGASTSVEEFYHIGYFFSDWSRCPLNKASCFPAGDGGNKDHCTLGTGDFSPEKRRQSLPVPTDQASLGPILQRWNDAYQTFVYIYRAFPRRPWDEIKRGKCMKNISQAASVKKIHWAEVQIVYTSHH